MKIWMVRRKDASAHWSNLGGVFTTPISPLGTIHRVDYVRSWVRRKDAVAYINEHLPVAYFEPFALVPENPKRKGRA